MREPSLDERILGPASTRGCNPVRVRFRFSFMTGSWERLRVAQCVIGKSAWWEGSWWTAVRLDVPLVDKGEPWVATLTLSEEGPQPETFELPSLLEYLKAVEVPAT
jgi:hypothetical protein